MIAESLMKEIRSGNVLKGCSQGRVLGVFGTGIGA